MDSDDQEFSQQQRSSSTTDAEEALRSSSLRSGHVYTDTHAQDHSQVHYGDQITTNYNYGPVQQVPGVGSLTQTRGDQQKTLPELLEFPEMYSRYTTISQKQAGSCDWLLSRAEWLNWRDAAQASEHGGFLWIKGKAGSGKSTMMKFALHTMQSQSSDHVLLSHFFNARGMDLESSICGMYRALIFQAIEKLPHLNESLKKLPFRPQKPHDLTAEVLKDVFNVIVENLSDRHLTCFIDALDECNEDDVRDMLSVFEDIASTAAASSVEFRVCFSSRHYPHIAFDKCIQLVLENQPEHKIDIARYVQRQLRIGKSRQAHEIRKEIGRRASGIFLWVNLVIPILNKKYDCGNVHELQKRLNEIPDKLEDLYDSIIHDSLDDTGALVLTLQWILYAQRPLEYHELYFAIRGSQDGSAVLSWDQDEITDEDMQRFILNASRGLAELTIPKGTVHFIHESVRNYLSSSKGLPKLAPRLRENLNGLSHDDLKQCCQNFIILYLVAETPNTDLQTAVQSTQMEEVDDSDQDSILDADASRQHPFAHYAVSGLLFHANAAQQYGVLQQVFIEEFTRLEWLSLHNIFHVNHDGLHVQRLRIFAELCYNSLLELEISQAANYDSEWKVNCVDALRLAACVGNEQGVRLLLDKGVSPMAADGRGDEDAHISRFYGESAFDVAVRTGNKKMVLTMLEYGAEFGGDPQRNSQRLCFVARAGHFEIVQLLCKEHVDIDFSGSYGTALRGASAWGYTSIAKLLLNHGADANGTGSDEGASRCQNNPLLAAIGTGRIDGVALLLQHGARLVEQPLHAAVLTRSLDITDLLVRHGADVTENHCLIGTPLHTACAAGDVNMAKFLLNNGAKPDDHNERLGMPLHVASARGHVQIAEILLQSGADPNSSDESWGTPLHVASGFFRNDVVQLLLQHGANVNAEGGIFGSALRAASMNGQKGLVQMLLLGGADASLIPTIPDVLQDEKERIHLDKPISWFNLSTGCRDLAMEHERNILASYREPAGCNAVEAARSRGHDHIVQIILDWSARPASDSKYTVPSGEHSGGFSM